MEKNQHKCFKNEVIPMLIPILQEKNTRKYSCGTLLNFILYSLTFNNILKLVGDMDLI